MKTTRIEAMLVLLLGLLFWAETASAFYNPLVGRWLSRDPISERGGANVYSFVRNLPTTSSDKLGLSIWEMSFTGQLHGSVERYRPGTWPWSSAFDQIAITQAGQRATAEWGSVFMNYLVVGTKFYANVDAMTDFSKATTDTTSLQASVFVRGRVKVKGCCSSGRVKIAWSASGSQDLGLRSEVTINTDSLKTSETSTSFRRRGQFTLSLGGGISGEVSFPVETTTYWTDVSPSSIRQSGAAELLVTAKCDYGP